MDPSLLTAYHPSSNPAFERSKRKTQPLPKQKQSPYTIGSIPDPDYNKPKFINNGPTTPTSSVVNPIGSIQNSWNTLINRYTKVQDAKGDDELMNAREKEAVEPFFAVIKLIKEDQNARKYVEQQLKDGEQLIQTANTNEAVKKLILLAALLNDLNKELKNNPLPGNALKELYEGILSQKGGKRSRKTNGRKTRKALRKRRTARRH